MSENEKIRRVQQLFSQVCELMTTEEQDLFQSYPQVEHNFRDIFESQATLAPGQRIGAYELIRPIGEGAMGKVWAAQQAQPARQVTIKFLSPGFGSMPTTMGLYIEI